MNEMDSKYCVWELKQTHNGDSNSKTVTLPRGKTTIGRGMNNTMRCPNQMSSRNHCEIKLLDSGLIFIKDLKSLNGTFLGSARILPERYNALSNGDTIGIGVESTDLSDNAMFNIFHLTQRLLEKNELDSGRYDNNLVPLNSLSSEGFNNFGHNLICGRSNNEIDNARISKLRSGSDIFVNQCRLQSPQNKEVETKVNVLTRNASNYCDVNNAVSLEAQIDNNDNSVAYNGHLTKPSTSGNVAEPNTTNSFFIPKQNSAGAETDCGTSNICKPHSCCEERSSDSCFVNNAVQNVHCANECITNLQMVDTTELKLCNIKNTEEFERNKEKISTSKRLKNVSNFTSQTLVSRLYQDDKADRDIIKDSKRSVNCKLFADSASTNKNSKEKGISNVNVKFTQISNKSFSPGINESLQNDSALGIPITENNRPKINEYTHPSADRNQEHTSSLNDMPNGNDEPMDNIVQGIFNRRLSNTSDLNENLNRNASMDNSQSKNKFLDKCPYVNITSLIHSGDQFDETKEQRPETIYIPETPNSAAKVESFVSESFTVDDDVITIDDDDESLLPCSQMFDVKSEEIESDVKDSDIPTVDIIDEDDILSEDSSDEWFLRLSQCDTLNLKSLGHIDDANNANSEDEFNEDIKIKISQPNVFESKFDCNYDIPNEDSGNQLPMKLQTGESIDENKPMNENTKRISEVENVTYPVPPPVNDLNVCINSPNSKHKRKHDSDEFIHNSVMVYEQEEGHHLHSKRTKKSHRRKSRLIESDSSCKSTKNTGKPTWEYLIDEIVEFSNEWDENETHTSRCDSNNSKNINTNISLQTNEKHNIQEQEGVVGTKLFSNDLHLTSRKTVQITKGSTEETNHMNKSSNNIESYKLQNHSDCSSKLNTAEESKLDAIQKKISANYDKKPTPVVGAQFLPVKKKRLLSPNSGLEISKDVPCNEKKTHESKHWVAKSRKVSKVPSLSTDKKAERKLKLAEIANKTKTQEKSVKNTKENKSIKNAIKNTAKTRAEMFIDELVPNYSSSKVEQSTDDDKVTQKKSLSRYKIPKKTSKIDDKMESEISIINVGSCSKQTCENVSEVNTTNLNKKNEINESKNSLHTKSTEMGLSNPQEINNCGIDKIDANTPHLGKTEKTSKITESNPNERLQYDQKVKEQQTKVLIGGVKSIIKKPNRESNLNNNLTKKKVHFHCGDEHLIVKTKYIDIEEGSSLKPVTKSVVKKDPPPERLYVGNDPRMPYFNYFDETLYFIFMWNAKWFEEKNKCKGDPPVFTGQIYHMQDSFSGYSEYRRSVFPLMLHELWASVAREHDLIINKNKSFIIEIQNVSIKQITHTFFPLQDCERKTLCQLECKILLETSNKPLWPRRSDLVVLDTRIIDPNGKSVRTRILGYICVCNTRAISSHSGVSQKLKAKNLKATIAMDLTICMRDRHEIDNTQESRIAVIKNIRPDMRHFNALDCLSTSSMLNIVCQPSINNLDVPLMLDIKRGKYPIISHLNESQKNAVMNVASACLSNTDMIHFVHGPPGCGKSEVIISIIQMIFMAQVHNKQTERLKILLCAPSNAAIDDIFMRLMECRNKSSCKNQKLKMVRVGRTESTHKNVRSMTLDCLVENDLKKRRDILEDEQERMIELTNLEAKKNLLNYQLENLGSKKNDARFIRNVEMKLAGTIKSIKELEKGKNQKALVGKELRQKKKERELYILEGANVIASTLSSCYNHQMEEAHLIKNLKATCCIVDEATQCTEPEILIPLMMGVRQLVLVGDPLQLPATVLSATAKEHGYTRSMFARHRDWWQKQKPDELPKSQYHFLDTQYRMHPDIAKWPSEYFYNSSFKTHSSLEARSSTHPLLPYVILSHSFTQSNHEECNYEEATLVEQLVESINASGLCANRTIGIITPYNRQKELLKGKLHNIQVGTVDSFQGQERDIIILSCVRTEGVGFLKGMERLNVALTRARYTMIICGNFQSLQADSSWGSLLQDAKARGILKTVVKSYMPANLLRLILKTK